MYKVIVVEDEELIRTMLKLNLEKQGYSVVCVRDAEALLDNLNRQSFDIILLDIKLPGISGEDALEQLRNKGVRTPVLMLTAKKDIQTKVKTLSAGADDYLSKPFNMQELAARVRAIIRRSQAERVIPSKKIIRINRFDVNLDTRTASSNLGKIILTNKETELLHMFARNPGKPLSRTDILEEVWGMDVYPTPRTVDNFVLKFRKLFEDDPERPRLFVTVRSLGYRYDPR